MKVMFTIWAVDGSRRVPVAIEPTRVDAIEHYSDGYSAGTHKVQVAMWWGDENHTGVPAASRIIMRNKQEYVVQGTVESVTNALNAK